MLYNRRTDDLGDEGGAAVHARFAGHRYQLSWYAPNAMESQPGPSYPMNVKPFTPWILFFFLVLLGPLDAWAAGGGNASTDEQREANEAAQRKEERIILKKVGKVQLAGLDPDLSVNRYLRACSELGVDRSNLLEGIVSDWVSTDPEADRKANADALMKIVENRFDKCESVADLHSTLTKFCENPLDKPYDELPNLTVFDGWQALILPARRTGESFADAKDRIAAEPVPKSCAERSDEKGLRDSRGGVAAFGIGWQDALVRGVADFLTARMKAELELMVQERIADELCIGDAKDLLVDTCAMAKMMKDEGTPLAWGTLRAAVEKDLRQLPPRLATKLLATDNPELAAVLATTYQVMMAVYDGKDPVLVLAALNEISKSGVKGETCTSDSVWCALRMIGVGANVLGHDLNVRVPDKDREAYGKIAARIFLHEVFKNDANAQAAGRKRDETDTEYSSSVAIELPKIRRALEQVDQLARKAQQAKEKSSGQISNSQYFQVAEATLDAMTSLVQISLGVSDEDATCEQGKKECIAASFMAATDVAAAAEATSRGDYQSALVSIFAFATRLGADIPAPLLKYGGFLADLVAAKTSEDVEKALKAAAAPVGSYKVKRGIPGFQGRWEAHADLFSTEADCEAKAKEIRPPTDQTVRTRCKKTKTQQDDGKQTTKWQLETITRDSKPPWQVVAMKQNSNSPFTLSINGFAGVQGGFDILLDSVTPTPRAWQAGFFLPVGLDFAWGLRKTGSVSLFASAFDLGAVGNFRFADKNENQESPEPQGAMETMGDDTVKEVAVAPKVGLRQVISPGLYLTLGIPKTPLAFGAGASFAPELRSVSLDVDNDPVAKRESSLRIGAFIAVDIPMFVVYRSKRIKRAS